MEWLTLERWSPYAVGAGIGVLSWFAFLLSGESLGCSNTFTRFSGMLERLIRGAKVTDKEYYKVNPLIADWQMMLVLGIVIGGCISAVLSGTFALRLVPGRWLEMFGYTPLRRLLVALLGGVIMGFGSRWAGGCTSGHGISGALQLALSGWVSALCMFIGGIITAMIIL
ncbi:YeeE/YedE family protein [bacterium]|nr:YeeE/YedE family protein [candidate division CSSED10-310 bacterium]